MNKGKLSFICFLICLLAGCGVFPTTRLSDESKPQGYWPSNNWRSSIPEAQGMDSEMLATMFQQIEDQQLNLHSVVIVRNGYLVTEAYFQPYNQNQPQYIASVTKSVIATLVGIAIQKGYIKDVNQPLVSFFPDRRIANLDERKKAITIKDLLTLTAGLTCDDTPLAKGPTMQQSSNWVQFMLDLPMAEQPGTKWNYCSGVVHMLSAILQETTGMSARDFANRFLFEPMDIPTVTEVRWQMDPQGRTIGGWGLYLTPREMAKLGYLYLNNGQWNGQQIISADWVKAASTSYITRDSGLGYGYLWTVDAEKGYYVALGYAGQHIYVVPAKNLVIVFTATLPFPEMNADFYPLKALVDTYILPAVKSDQELPENTSAVFKLNEHISKAAFPKQSVPPLPEGAEQWSGLVYRMDPNPSQWETIAFEIKPGADVMPVTINGQVIDPLVGMDNVYRVQGVLEPYQVWASAPVALRGTWKNSSTLHLKEVRPGELMGQLDEMEIEVIFSPEEIHLTGTSVITGQELVNFHGVRATK